MLRHEVETMKRKFSDPRTNDPLSILRRLSEKDPVHVLVAVFEACMDLMSRQQRNMLNRFSQWALQDQTIRRLFLFAIYKGAYSAEMLVPSFFEELRSGFTDHTHSLVDTGPGHYHHQQRRTEGETRVGMCTTSLHINKCPVLRTPVLYVGSFHCSHKSTPRIVCSAASERALAEARVYCKHCRQVLLELGCTGHLHVRQVPLYC